MPATRVRVVAIALSLVLATGCAGRGEPTLAPIPAPSPDGERLQRPRALARPNAGLGPRGGEVQSRREKGSFSDMRQLLQRRLSPLAITISLLAAVPLQAFEQLDLQRQDRPIVRRRAPDGQRRHALAFVRTELFFGTAKPVGAVTEEEFEAFLDNVVTPLFPDGLTVTKANGQFKGADGLTIKEDSYVLVLLYPVEGQKASSRNIDWIRRAYMDRHQQESVLRVDDPFLVWVSF